MKLKLTGKQKALLITLGISAVLLIFLVHVTFVDNKTVVSGFFEVETVVEETPKEILNNTEDALNTKSQTNEAFNETQKSTAQTYVVPPAEDFNFELEKAQTTNTDNNNFIDTETISEYSQNQVNTISKKTLSAYNKANKILEQQKKNTLSIVNKNSTVSYFLNNRTAINLPIPVYLCDASGKVVVNILVNSVGKVISAKINNNLSSKNGCLQEQALKYAKNAFFNTATTNSQTGTITYFFQ